jgi:hypothetical protein
MRHLTWLDYQTTYLAPGVPSAYRILGDPTALIVSTSRVHQLRLSTRSAVTLPVLPEALTASIAWEGDAIWVVVELTDPSLLREFYSWSTLVCDLVQVDGLMVPAALREATRRWELLLRPEIVPTREALVGLTGELLTLEAFAQHNPARAVAAWVGPERAPFDIVFGTAAFEVKTTISATRVHTFHGMEQLHAPLRGASYILSWHLQEGGSNSLQRLVDGLRERLAGTPGLTGQFNEKLALTGAVSEDGTVRDLHFEVREAPMVLTVGADLFPSGGAWLTTSLGPALAGRVRNVSLQLDCSGLGSPFDSEMMERLLAKGDE